MSTALTTLNANKTGPKPKYKRLADHIESMYSGEPNTGCWLWSGSVDRKGYGQLTHNQVHMTAHRASYSAFKGCADGLLVCHDCDQPSCVNPAHLYAGTYADNRSDMLNRKRWSHPFAMRTHCSAGHEYLTVGASIATDGTRVCKECQKQNKRKQRSK